MTLTLQKTRESESGVIEQRDSWGGLGVIPWVRFYALKTYVRVRASSRSAVRVRVRAETLLDRI